jgi:hypothetical protein
VVTVMVDVPEPPLIVVGLKLVEKPASMALASMPLSSIIKIESLVRGYDSKRLSVLLYHT